MKDQNKIPTEMLPHDVVRFKGEMAIERKPGSATLEDVVDMLNQLHQAILSLKDSKVGENVRG